MRIDESYAFFSDCTRSTRRDAPVKYSLLVVANSESEVMLPSSRQCLLSHLQMADASTNDPCKETKKPD